MSPRYPVVGFFRSRYAGLFPPGSPRQGVSMSLRLILPAFALCASATLAGDSWPGFRGPGSDGRSDAKALPTNWSETENVIWKTAVHGRGHSSPVVLGNQVWVTTADEVMGEKNGKTPKGAPANPV